VTKSDYIRSTSDLTFTTQGITVRKKSTRGYKGFKATKYSSPIEHAEYLHNACPIILRQDYTSEIIADINEAPNVNTHAPWETIGKAPEVELAAVFCVGALLLAVVAAEEELEREEPDVEERDEDETEFGPLDAA